MRNNAPTFVIIGKPNNGKSSIISALTFNDMVEVSQKVGTTVARASYSYIRDNKIICSFYDTPGFEMAKDIWRYIKNNSQNTYANNRILRNYIRENKDEDSKQKDIEILEAVLDSDFIVFMLNSSERFNKNTIGAELEIISFIKKPTLVLFNQKSDKDYTKEWEKELNKYNLKQFYKINPLEMNFTNIMDIYEKLNTIDSSIQDRDFLKNLKHIHKKHIEENVEKSSIVIANMIKKVLHLEYEYQLYSDKITSQDKEQALQKYQDKIYKIEKQSKKDMAEIWGYFQIKIIDTREEFTSKENIQLGLSKKRLLLLGIATGVGTGASITAPASIFDMGITTAISSTIGGTLGGVGAYIVGEKFHKMVISNKKIIYKIDKKAYNVTIILLKRSLEYLYRLIKHGHANRENIVIPKDDDKLIFNSKWNFDNADAKEIIKIHRYIVKDENTREYIERLHLIINKLIKNIF